MTIPTLCPACGLRPVGVLLRDGTALCRRCNNKRAEAEYRELLAQEYERHLQAGLTPPERWRRVDPPTTEEEQS